MSQLKTLFLSALLICMGSSAKAQSFQFKELPLSVSYYGENGFHPGFKIGTFKTVWSAEKSKLYRGKRRKEKYGTKTKLRELNVDFGLGLYSHPNNHTGYFVQTGATYLRTKLRKNRQMGISFEIGYLRRMNKFVTYELNEDGTFREVGGAGNNAMTIGLAPQFGQEFLIKDNPVRFYVKPIFQMVQYAHSWQPNVNLEVGTVININRSK